MAEARSPQAFVEDLRTLVARNIAGNVELASRLNALIKQMGDVSASQPSLDPSELLRRWLDFNLASYAVTSAHSLAAMNEVIAAAERAIAGSASLGPHPARERQIEVRLEVRSGARASCPFMVENQYDSQVDVSFEAGPLVPVGTAPTLSASLVSFDPVSLTVPPRGQAVGTAQIDVGPDFVVGETYRTTIRVIGFEGREIGLALGILPAAERARAAPKKAVKAAARRPAKASAAKSTRRAAQPVRRARTPKRRPVRSSDAQS
jgi:hypothetical protein